MYGYSFAERRFIDPVQREDAIRLLGTSVLPFEPSLDAFLEHIRAPEPKSIIRLGDTDACLLCLKFEESEEGRQALLDRLWWSGIDKDDFPSPDSFYDVMRRADLLMVQPGVEGNESFWGDSYVALAAGGFLDGRTYLDMHVVYHAANYGMLFGALAGRKVALVGAKALHFHRYFYPNAAYRARFPGLGLEHLNLVQAITTPDVHEHGMSRLPEVLDQIRQSFSYDIDVYLLACGTLAKYLAVAIKEEAGRSAWDIGNVLEVMMGLKNDRVYLCGPFKDYQHPEYEFVIGGKMEILDVRRRGKLAP